MNIEKLIKEAMARMIERKKNIESVDVHWWEEETSGGFDGCDTCGYGASSPYEVHIYYTSSSNSTPTYFYYDGSFGELIKELSTDG
jgi:hypothetical protein